MSTNPKFQRQLKIIISLSLLALFSFALSIIRVFITGHITFLFLNWNLFLAFIPLLISTVLLQRRIQKNKLIFAIFFLSWLLFFPNAPYIITDLIHLKLLSYVHTLWYDLILIMSFTWTGLVFGLVSLLNVEKALQKFITPQKTNFLMMALLFLSGFGIYLGRFLRRNTWDVLTNPGGLFYDIFIRLIDPLSHSDTWGITIIIGIFLNLIYFSFKALVAKK